MRPELSIVIPAYNEARRLGPTLVEMTDYLESRGEPYELLVVDDGSTDETPRVVESSPLPAVRLVRQPENRGKGAAVRRGILETVGRRVLFSDADHSVRIHQLPLLEARLADGAQVVIASRGVATSLLSTRQPLYRQLMGKTFNWTIRRLGVTHFRDTQCGFKLFEGELARHLFRQTTIDGFAFDVEVLFLAQRLGIRVDEVGVEWIDSAGSRVDPIRDSLHMLRDVSRMRWRHRL